MLKSPGKRKSCVTQANWRSCGLYSTVISNPAGRKAKGINTPPQFPPSCWSPVGAYLWLNSARSQRGMEIHTGQTSRAQASQNKAESRCRRATIRWPAQPHSCKEGRGLDGICKVFDKVIWCCTLEAAKIFFSLA